MKFDKTNYTNPPSFPWLLLYGSVFASRSYSVCDKGPSLCYELETLARRGRVSNRFWVDKRERGGAHTLILDSFKATYSPESGLREPRLSRAYMTLYRILL